MLWHVAHGCRTVAVGELAVEIGDVAITARLQRRADGLAEGRPLFGLEAADGDRAFLAMQLAVPVEIVFQALEVGQHALPAPAGRALRFPVVIVGRQAA